MNNPHRINFKVRNKSISKAHPNPNNFPHVAPQTAANEIFFFTLRRVSQLNKIHPRKLAKVTRLKPYHQPPQTQASPATSPKHHTPHVAPPSASSPKHHP
jgi:hypothetical protein